MVYIFENWMKDAHKVSEFSKMYSHGDVLRSISDSVKRLWNDQEKSWIFIKFSTKILIAIFKIVYLLTRKIGVREAFSKSNQYQLLDSAEYFLDNAGRIFAPKYVPTKNDIIRTRAKTTGIVEISFKFRELTFKMVDVGGQRWVQG